MVTSAGWSPSAGCTTSQICAICLTKNLEIIVQELDALSSNSPYKHAKLPENRARNRYREVSPFDHSRVCLQTGTNDYINANLVNMKEARRKYILTQGPLPSTSGHFWQMVWEQRSAGVVMLNRIIELGSVKCAQYWPPPEIRELVFKDTEFRLTLIREDEKAICVVRHLELENMKTAEVRRVMHFHYTAWPDFGVPKSPASFLSFILLVRVSGCLSEDRGPAVVHCSGGIGRSGVFCLVDTCLLLMSLREDPHTVCVRDVLLEMRQFRMDLVQNSQQLRFAYWAIIEGSRPILRSRGLQEPTNDTDDEDVFTRTYPPIRPPGRPGLQEHLVFSETEDEDYLMAEASCSTAPGVDRSSWTEDASELPGPVRSVTPHVLGLELRTAGDKAATSSPLRGGGAGAPVASALATAYLCATLALGAYICYRAFLR